MLGHRGGSHTAHPCLCGDSGPKSDSDPTTDLVVLPLPSPRFFSLPLDSTACPISEKPCPAPEPKPPNWDGPTRSFDNSLFIALTQPDPLRPQLPRSVPSTFSS